MKFIMATKNAHKLEEMARILKPLGICVVSENDLAAPLSEVEETGATFEQNAYLKAESAMRQTGLPAIADDSGLCVDALNGSPGVYSSRYAGENATDRERIQKLLRELNGLKAEERTARFVSAVVCILPNGRSLTVRGECEGTIAFEPVGENGFGYDPVFLTPAGGFAEMTAEEKDTVSHRGKAMRELQRKLPEFLKECSKIEYVPEI